MPSAKLTESLSLTVCYWICVRPTCIAVSDLPTVIITN